MKTFTLSIIFCLATLFSSAQWSQKFMAGRKHFLYSSGDYVVGKSNGANLGLNYIFDNSYILNIGYSATNKTMSSLPADYLKSGSQLPAIDDEGLFQNMENVYIMVGKVININKSRTIRLILQGGPGFSTVRSPNFTPYENNTQFETNYDYEIEAKEKLSLVLNPKIEIPFRRMIGFSVGPMIVMNKENKYFGAGIGLMYGIVRNE